MDTTVVKGFRVLEALARTDQPMRLSDLADELGLQRSNAHRLLSTLAALGYVEKDAASGRYRATLRMWEFGLGALARHPLKRFAAPYMQELHRTTGETVSLTLLEGVEVLYIDKLLSPRPLRFTTQPGSRLPALLCASGWAMLAQTPNRRPLVEEAVATNPRAGELDPDAVDAEMETIRADGFVSFNGRWTPGLVAVAAAIPGRDGRPVGALTISGPAQRFKPAARTAAVEAVMHACTLIAEAGGG